MIVRAPAGPSIRAITLPAFAPVSAALASSCGSSPAARSSSSRTSTISRSRPEGLSISQRRTKSRRRRSFSALEARGATVAVKR